MSDLLMNDNNCGKFKYRLKNKKVKNKTVILWVIRIIVTFEVAIYRKTLIS